VKERIGISLFLLPYSLLLAVSSFAEPGTITGLVRFPGETPPAVMIVNETDDRCPPGIPRNHLIVQQTNRGIKNVLVVLEHPPVRVKPWLPAPLTNDTCVYEPRLRWMPVSTALLLDNPGVADHHVRAWRGEFSVFDVRLKPGVSGLRRPLVNTGLYKVNCDLHLWERSWVHVSDHPFVAITDEKGLFEIKEVPPGTYTLRAWHEGWVENAKDKDGRREFQPMEQTLKVRVRAEQTTDVLFEDLKPTF